MCFVCVLPEHDGRSSGGGYLLFRSGSFFSFLIQIGLKERVCVCGLRGKRAQGEGGEKACCFLFRARSSLTAHTPRLPEGSAPAQCVKRTRHRKAE